MDARVRRANRAAMAGFPYTSLHDPDSAPAVVSPMRASDSTLHPPEPSSGIRTTRKEAMATITITKLRCVRQQDVSGDDEPVIYLGGQYVWEGKMDKDDWEYPNESRTFGPSILVQLKEKNGTNSYKTLGSWTINDVAATNKKLTASSSGYHYELFYSVT